MAQKIAKEKKSKKARAPWSKRKTVLVSLAGIVVVAAVSCATLLVISKMTSVKADEREAEIVQKVENYRGEVVGGCTTFVTELNELSEGAFSDDDGVDGERIENYIAKLDALEVPDEVFAGAIADYRAAWVELQDRYTAKEYIETLAALAVVQEAAAKASAEINAMMDDMIQAKIEAYENGLREEE